ncbi:MAG: hypothetical protein WBI63_01770 [Coriobacteriia bacterium]
MRAQLRWLFAVPMVTVLLAATLGMVAAGDCDQLRLRDGSCQTAADQIQDRDCGEECVPIGDGIPDQDRIQLQIHLYDCA